MLRPVNDVFFDKKIWRCQCVCVCGIVIKLAFSVFQSLPSTRRSPEKLPLRTVALLAPAAASLYKASCQVEVGVSKNRGTPKWMVYNGIENPIKMDDLGGKPTIFRNTQVNWEQQLRLQPQPQRNNHLFAWTD